MPGSGQPVYYWDTCCFLAWLKDEKRAAGEMDGLRACIDRFKRGQVRIITSVLTYIEVSTAKIPVGVETLFEDALQRPNAGKIGVDIRVAKLARDLRNHYLNTRTDSLTLSIPDSIHLATAILCRVSEFQTFDQHDDRKYRSLGILPLNGNVAGHNLTICKPSTAQLELSLQTPPASPTES